jgi:hypothetical protein
MATKDKKLKTIDLKGKKYVQVNTRVEFFNEAYANGRIKTEVNFSGDTVWFKAIVTPDIENKDRFFVGHSFGQLGKEKAFEKLETVAVGRALAFMGIGIVESIASSDEMNNFTNNQPKCSICGKNMLTSQKGNLYCPDWQKHKANGEGRSNPIYSEIQSKVNDNKNNFMDELDATEYIPNEINKY